MAAILGPGDHLRQHNLPQMVRGDHAVVAGDQLRRDRSIVVFQLNFSLM